MINPYDRSAVIKLLRQAADHTAQGHVSIAICADLHNLADHLEQED